MSLRKGQLVQAVQDQYNWNASDYMGEDELKGVAREQPAFGTERHRWLSTVRLLQVELEELRSI